MLSCNPFPRQVFGGGERSAGRTEVGHQYPLKWQVRPTCTKEIDTGGPIEYRTRRALDYAEFERILGQLPNVR